MTIRIDSIESELTDGGYIWRLRAKGLYGQGLYFTIESGLNGHGLYAVTNRWELDLIADQDRVVTSNDQHDRMRGDSRIELVPPDRIHLHAECTARDVIHRVATALTMIGWGPEMIDDRDAISGKFTVRATVIDRRVNGVDA